VDDPFGTAALRTAVLDAWAASPTRFREDANAEEDLRLGGYADTWFVELAQNAADAAGGAGRLRITLVGDAAAGTRPAAVGGVAGRAPAETRPGDGGEAGSGSAAAAGAESDVGIPAAGLEQAAWAVGADSGQTCGAVAAGRAELRVANTGAPLTAAGVAALASLRASAKRDEAGAVGRFGVGFAAVLAVSTEPRVVSTSGAVAFSADRTAAAVADLPGPSAELARRDTPPVLRLVWPSAEHPPDGYSTEVRLPLRDGVDGAALLANARSTAPDLLLALWRAVVPEDDNDSDGRYFESVLAAMPGYYAEAAVSGPAIGRGHCPRSAQDRRSAPGGAPTANPTAPVEANSWTRSSRRSAPVSPPHSPNSSRSAAP